MRVLLTIFLMVAFFANPLSAQELSGTLKRIQESGKIKIGYRQSLPPFSFIDKDNQPAGYSIDLGKSIVAAVKEKVGKDVKIEYVAVTPESRFEALSKNQIDILCGATTKTISRDEIVDFTQLTFVTGGSFMTLRGKNIRNNFSGKKIGVIKSTTTIAKLRKLFIETQTVAELVTFNSSEEGFAALEQEKIDAFAADQVVLIGLAMAADKPANFSILPELFSYEPFALAVRKNDSDFRAIADSVISRLYRSKDILTIYDKWFGEFSSRRTGAFEALIMINAIPE
ncbi:MAG: amino acid ABC transporter substrate-binding protein [Deltaproteobacteria bacterium]|nr:amino acid ABC transporter substrate-binding protein [Candidatus Tharpella aukensis]